MSRAILTVAMLLSLAACERETATPKSGPSAKLATPGAAIVSVGNDVAALPGTPMAQRVAVIGLLNKRNGQTRDLIMKPGQALRAGDAIIRLRACEATAPWENTPEVGAFFQLDVRSAADGRWRRAFSGWLFRERPERNVVQHPIFDVWVRECRMIWPEKGADTLSVGEKGKAAVPGKAASPVDAGEPSAADLPDQQGA